MEKGESPNTIIRVIPLFPIKFDKSMLNWKKGNHPNDGIWWQHWYDNVINTSGFQKYQKKDITIENKYDSIYNESMEYYNHLREAK